MDDKTASAQAELLMAAAHPTRLMILAALANGVKCVNDILELLDLPQPNVSQHLKELRHSGLVDFYREGARHCYYLSKPALARDLFDFLGRDYPTVAPDRDRAATDAQK